MMANAITTESGAVDSAGTQLRTWRIQPTGAETDPVWFMRRMRRRKIWLGVLTPVVLLLLWEVASQLQWIDAKFFPGPSRIVVAGADMVASGQWFMDMGHTLRTIVVAGVTGFVVGVLLGVFMGAFSYVRHLFEPVLSAFYTIPKIALLPLMLLIFGIGDVPGNLLVGIDVFFVAWISTVEAVLKVPEGYREAAEAFGVKGWREFGHVTLPAILPAIFVAIRIAVGQAVVITIVVEYLMGDAGIGYRIWHSWSLFDANTMYVGIVSVAILGYLLQLLVRLVSAKAIPWSTSAGEK